MAATSRKVSGQPPPQDLVDPTREEEGCTSYHPYSSKSETGMFITIEEWRSQADLDNHLSTVHVQRALLVAGDHLAEPPGIHPLATLHES